MIHPYIVACDIKKAVFILIILAYSISKFYISVRTVGEFDLLTLAISAQVSQHSLFIGRRKTKSNPFP